MNILGIGTDIVEIKRVKKIYNKYGDNFARKILSNDEFKKYKFSNVLFNCSYIFGFAAFQGILTVDLTGIYTFGDMLALHLQHSLIVLNVLWLIVVFGYKFSFRGIFDSMIVINILAFFTMIVNYFLGSNYMFLCVPPAVDNPLIIGNWPWYILSFEVLFLVFGFILLSPFKLFDYINKYNQN